MKALSSHQDGNDPLEKLGLTPALRNQLKKLHLHHPFAVLLHVPLRYEDETRITPIGSLKPGHPACVEAQVVHTEVTRRPRKILKVLVRDESAALVLRFLHFYGSQIQALKPDTRLRLFGEVRPGLLGAEMIHPRYRILQAPSPLPQTLTPIYTTTAGLSQERLRQSVQRALQHADLEELLPQEMRQALGLPGLEESLRMIHHPTDPEHVQALLDRTHRVWRRLKFDEILAQQISMLLHRQRRQKIKAPFLPGSAQQRQAFLQRLPFALTQAQQRVVQEIDADLVKPYPMQRLLQGDVGSGKTMVAALACLQAISSGYQAALMAPTEILCDQLFRQIDARLQPLGISSVWLTGQLSRKERASALIRIQSGVAQLVVGTHALLQDWVDFKALGLVVIDEQQRFGVEQRLWLRQRSQQSHLGIPHQLMMSATPIPRTLSMSYFADLDLSVLDGLPPGRQPIITKLVDDRRRQQVIERVRTTCLQGGQAYWVCPLIEESEALQLQTAVATFEHLSRTFPDLQVGLVHGRMPAQQKADCMMRFGTGEIQLLVATTVIEVGVDVPAATIMVIEHAERMGLAQLHQLRGRIGRGTQQGVCLLLYHHPLSALARARLKVIFENQDGFEVARQDLLLRGPGEYLGIRQSGEGLLRFGDPERDEDLLQEAALWAKRWVARAPHEAQCHALRWLATEQDLLGA